MGFFDKIKASVGIGGAELSIECPQVLTSEQPFTANVTLRGGKIEQKLTKLDLFFRVNAPPAEQGKSQESYEDIPLQAPANSSNCTIAPGAELRFEVALTALATQRLYLDDIERYAQLMLDDSDERRWNAEGPLPFIHGWEGRKAYFCVNADIPGAVDPYKQQWVHFLPAAAGNLCSVSGLTVDTLGERLKAAKAERVLISDSSDNWFAYWSNGVGAVVAYSPLKIVCSARPDGLHRSYTNPNIPKEAVLAKLPTETADRIDGDLDDGKAWATKLIAEAKAGVLLPRPIGNAWAVLTDLRILS